MNNDSEKFEVGFEFLSVLEAMSKHIYDTPYAFLRENLQNAVDASRMQARRQQLAPSDPSFRIDISVHDNAVRIQDRGIGMSPDDLRYLFWRIGASGKRNEEARAAGCVGMFGIGGFANFGVCSKLVVTSKSESTPGERTELSSFEIQTAVGLPQVAHQQSDEASPRGTIVEGLLQVPADTDGLRQFIEEIVRYCREPVYFNGELISEASAEPELNGHASDSPQTWHQDDIQLTGQLYEINEQTLGASLEGLLLGGQQSRLSAVLRFEGSGLDVRKQGFKLCSTTVPSMIGVSGFIDCDLLSPTAGRDSLNAESNTTLAKIVSTMERAAVLAVLESSALIDQHTRIFRYVRSNRLVQKIGKVTVQSAAGGWFRLDEILSRARQGTQVYFGTAGNAALINVLQARGHLVLNLPADNHKAAAIREFLSEVNASDLKGQVECEEEYTDLSRFEKAFLAELSETITSIYQVPNVHLLPGKLTEDIPIFVANAYSSATSALRILVDVRHQDIQKLERLGMTSLFRSMVSAFCREYLGTTLRSRSPKFFGSGAVNLDWLAQFRSEAWILLTDDIAVVNRAVRRQVVTASDVRVVTATPGNEATQPERGDPGSEPKLVRIMGGGEEFAGLDGYYLRIPNSATQAFGDVIIASDDRGATWMGNKIHLMASDGISTAFQFDITLDELMFDLDTKALSQGAVEIGRSIQELFGGLYFPLPGELETHLVPVGDRKIRIQVDCDWVDFVGSRKWQVRNPE